MSYPQRKTTGGKYEMATDIVVGRAPPLKIKGACDDTITVLLPFYKGWVERG